ncbi:CPBP family intramembrane glutamic endopeptidase [Candidatus Clostridium stratigraminis]|uniref:CPBP family intramembrane glutamic endopeptidase n=1 Tax=Candidatus Clostridium stratigraminis TaxID=3381661 RepID=A0ABW8T7G9_9CLOT
MLGKTQKSILTLAIATVFQFVILYGVILFNQNILMNFTLVERMLLMFSTQWIFLIIPVLFMLKNKEKLKDIGFTRINISIQILSGIGIAIAMCLIFTVIPILCGLKDMVSSTHYTKAWQFIFEFFYSIFGVALAEEFFFRGYMFKKLMDIKNSKWFAIIISSIVFGLFHIFQGNIIQVFTTMVLGVMFCLLRDKIKGCSTLSLIFAHGVYDALIVLCVALL